MNSHREILDLAKLVAEECCGLPLALITIGRAMASKKTPEEWKHAIKALETSPADISGTETEVFFRLKLSYDSLPNDIIKSCFLYCSLFPEDYDISKEDLIDYWIGEGFLDEWDDDLDSARNKGHDLIGTLKSACLLESAYNEKSEVGDDLYGTLKSAHLLESASDEKTKVKMHDVIRDLALWISSECGKKKNKFLVKAGVGLREAPAIERWTEANRTSLMDNKIIEITETPKCPDLLTLMREVTEESGWFYFTEIEGLKWLSHLETTIETVHDLKSYLDSHKLPKMTWALTIGIRKGLTTSTLLSSSFRAMRSIRLLEIVDCKEMEEMMIGWDAEKEDDHSVWSLESIMLWGLDNLNIIRVGGCIQNLSHINISFCPKLKTVTWILQLQNLERIWIQGCEGVEEVIGTSDVRDACPRFLKSLGLFGVPKLTSICNHALAFPSLEKLVVFECPQLKKLPIGLQSANNPLKVIYGEKEWRDGLEWEEDGIKSKLLPLLKKKIPRIQLLYPK